MHNIVRNISHRITTRRGHDIESGSMTGTTVNNPSVMTNAPFASSDNVAPLVGTVAPTYRAPPHGVIPSPGMRGAVYTNHTRLIVRYIEPLHKERMHYDPTTAEEPQLCFQLPLPTEFKPGTIISMFILGEPVCAVVQEVTPDEDGEKPGVDAKSPTAGIEWEHGDDYVDVGDMQREGVLIHTQVDTRHSPPMPGPELVGNTPVTHKPPQQEESTNFPIPTPRPLRNAVPQRKTTLKSLLKGPFTFFRRTQVAGPNGNLRDSIMVYQDLRRASLAEGDERMLYRLDRQQAGASAFENEAIEAQDHDEEHHPGGIRLVSNIPADSRMLGLAAHKIVEQGDASRSSSPVSPIASYSAHYPVNDGVVLLSRSPSPYSEHDSYLPPHQQRSEETLKYTNSPRQSLRRTSTLSYSLRRVSIPSPAVSVPRHPGAAQATLQRRDTHTTQSHHRSGDAMQRDSGQRQLSEVGRRESNSRSDMGQAIRGTMENELDLAALEKHLTDRPPLAKQTREKHARKRTLSASGIRNMLGQAFSRNVPSAPTLGPPEKPRPRASSMSASVSNSSAGRLRLPEIVVGETASWKKTFGDFEPVTTERAPMPPPGVGGTGLLLSKSPSGLSKGQSHKDPRDNTPGVRQASPVTSLSPPYVSARLPSFSPSWQHTLPQPRPRTQPEPPTRQGSYPSTAGMSGSSSTMRPVQSFTPMLPHLPRRRNPSTMTNETRFSSTTTGSTRDARQHSRNLSKQKPLPLPPSASVTTAHGYRQSGSSLGNTDHGRASPATRNPTSSPHGTVSSGGSSVRRPSLQHLTDGLLTLPRNQEQHSEGSHHTRLLSNSPPPPRASLREHTHSHSLASTSASRHPIPGPSKSRQSSSSRPLLFPSPKPSGVSALPPSSSTIMKPSTSDSTTASSTMDGYQTAPSIPSISDAFDKSSYRAETPRVDADSEIDSDDVDTEAGELSDGDTDTDKEVDRTRRNTNSSWAVPANAIDAHGNKRAAILSGKSRVYFEPPTPTLPYVFDAAAVASRPPRPAPPRPAPPREAPSAPYPSRF